MKVIAAMSGGVDSAVAAARAVEMGHEVVGVHLALSSNPQKYRSGARGCCTIEDSHDARRAADVIGIPFYIWDMAEEFHDNVVENFIEVLNTKQLANAMFPLGDTKKEDVRKEAKARGLYVANKPDSHDICFIPSGNNAGWLRDRLGGESGPIVDQEGNKVGEHQGAYTYTVGQRRGLGLSVPAEGGVPRYVLKIEPKSNTVVVGTKDLLAESTIVGEKPIWCGRPPVFDISIRGFAQIRAHGAALACSYIATDSSITAILDEPLLGLATGQGLVIFDGDRVVGSATVSATE